jgi:HTH-type transcriptional regulator/antitoxin HigA
MGSGRFKRVSVIKVIKSEADHTAALTRLEQLMDLNPAAGSPEAEELEVLALLIRNYESSRFPTARPDPIEALLFRMDQQKLTQRDLVPYIGSRSKVSEVLRRKRPLTLSMIRALHSGLGIPAESLLQEQSPDLLQEADLDPRRFPVREMAARGYFGDVGSLGHRDTEALLRSFFAPVRGHNKAYALFRKTLRSTRSIDKYALAAWTVRVIVRAAEKSVQLTQHSGIVTTELMRELSQLSWSARGPLLAEELLQKHGIPLVIEPHLSKTRLDGAAILFAKSRPIIGLTLRHDRLDNFWFCLMHELAHVALHLKSEGDGFYDDLDIEDADDPREREADNLAREVLIPDGAWKQSPARVLRSPEAAERLAEKLRIHPAIVVGRMRYETKNYRILGQMLGRGEVRKLFRNISWGEEQ